jgi:hypothetical protein
MPRGIYPRKSLAIAKAFPERQRKPVHFDEAKSIERAAMEYRRAFHAASEAAEASTIAHEKALEARQRLLDVIHGENQGTEVDE